MSAYATPGRDHAGSSTINDIRARLANVRAEMQAAGSGPSTPRAYPHHHSVGVASSHAAPQLNLPTAYSRPPVAATPVGSRAQSVASVGVPPVAYSTPSASPARPLTQIPSGLVTTPGPTAMPQSSSVDGSLPPALVQYKAKLQQELRGSVEENGFAATATVAEPADAPQATTSTFGDAEAVRFAAPVSPGGGVPPTIVAPSVPAQVPAAGAAALVPMEGGSMATVPHAELTALRRRVFEAERKQTDAEDQAAMTTKLLDAARDDLKDLREKVAVKDQGLTELCDQLEGTGRKLDAAVKDKALMQESSAKDAAADRAQLERIRSELDRKTRAFDDLKAQGHRDMENLMADSKRLEGDLRAQLGRKERELTAAAAELRSLREERDDSRAKFASAVTRHQGQLLELQEKFQQHTAAESTARAADEERDEAIAALENVTSDRDALQRRLATAQAELAQARSDLFGTEAALNVSQSALKASEARVPAAVSVGHVLDSIEERQSPSVSPKRSGAGSRATSSARLLQDEESAESPPSASVTAELTTLRRTVALLQRQLDENNMLLAEHAARAAKQRNAAAAGVSGASTSNGGPPLAPRAVSTGASHGPVVSGTSAAAARPSIPAVVPGGYVADANVAPRPVLSMFEKGTVLNADGTRRTLFDSLPTYTTHAANGADREASSVDASAIHAAGTPERRGTRPPFSLNPYEAGESPESLAAMRRALETVNHAAHASSSDDEN